MLEETLVVIHERTPEHYTGTEVVVAVTHQRGQSFLRSGLEG